LEIDESLCQFKNTILFYGFLSLSRELFMLSLELFLLSLDIGLYIHIHI
jgi:hypothetical protein